jgi:SAM-dependent methyltransferase
MAKRSWYRIFLVVALNSYMTNSDWKIKADAYAAMATDKDRDAYEYLINFPSILKLAEGLSANTVLDAGAGTADFTHILKERFSAVDACDGSEEMIEIAKSLYPNLNIFHWDMEQSFPFTDKKYDLIIVKLVLMFVSNLENVAAQLAKIMNDKGAVIVSVPHPTSWYERHLLNAAGVKKSPEFAVMTNGYFTEVGIQRSIGGAEDLQFEFIHRPLTTYINTFTKAGFVVDLVDEPQLTEEFVAKYPDYANKKGTPTRLNFRLRKL